MELSDLVGALAIGLAAGMAGGLVGVGGGVLMVPGLVIFLGESQLEAEATSLLAIVGVAAVGAWRQNGYGNLRLSDAVVIGVLSPLGVLVGPSSPTPSASGCWRSRSPPSRSTSPTAWRGARSRPPRRLKRRRGSLAA